MTGGERISSWVAQARATSRGIRLLRSAVAAAGAVALIVPGLQAWDQADIVPILGVPMLLVAVLLPDSLAGLIFLVIVAGGWLLRAPAEVSAGVVLVAMALVLFQVASAFAAQVPSYARLDPRVYRRWLLPTAIGLVVAPVVGLAAAVVRGAAVPGSLLVTVAALGLTTGVLWFSSSTRSPDRP